MSVTIELTEAEVGRLLKILHDAPAALTGVIDPSAEWRDAAMRVSKDLGSKILDQAKDQDADVSATLRE